MNTKKNEKEWQWFRHIVLCWCDSFHKCNSNWFRVLWLWLHLYLQRSFNCMDKHVLKSSCMFYLPFFSPEIFQIQKKSFVILRNCLISTLWWFIIFQTQCDILNWALPRWDLIWHVILRAVNKIFLVKSIVLTSLRQSEIYCSITSILILLTKALIWKKKKKLEYCMPSLKTFYSFYIR